MSWWGCPSPAGWGQGVSSCVTEVFLKLEGNFGGSYSLEGANFLGWPVIGQEAALRKRGEAGESRDSVTQETVL